MALLNQSVQVYGQLAKIFETLREGQAPTKFTRAHLKDIGFKSSNHLALIPLLKGLGFLTSDGAPTQRYKDFLDKTKWKSVLATALREAYGDIFLIKAKPADTDKDLIAGKYKSTFNLSGVAADRAARTFLALLSLADPNTLYADETKLQTPASKPESPPPADEKEKKPKPQGDHAPALHYNIQIHLPATKEVEIYNAIFKSIREHLFE